MNTIFALSSGSPPAGIAVVRISGSEAARVLTALAGRVPAARRATAMVLRDATGLELDRALVLWMPGPATATGEDVAELHLHGGRAVVAAVEGALASITGVRRAEPGEFTRRAFSNGRIDLTEAEGLADLLAAETELQRRTAQAMAGGVFSRHVEDWRVRVLALSAIVEATLDFGDEDDVGDLPPAFADQVEILAADMSDWLTRPRAEPLREGMRVVLAGPPNSGKSSLFNALLSEDAAIVADVEGTTRDVNARPVALRGMPFTFVDTAGLRAVAGDAIEDEGITRAHQQVADADLVLWLGPEGDGPPGSWELAAKSDLGFRKRDAVVQLSAHTGEGIDELINRLVVFAGEVLPKPGQAALNRRQYDLLTEAHAALVGCEGTSDVLVKAELLRLTRSHFDRLIGRTSTEDMLDALFGRFCIGK